MMMANKRTLEFKVTGQKITKSGDFSGLVHGTKGYLEVRFDCSQEWNGCRKAAVFARYEKEYFRPVVNGKAEVPDEIADLRNWTVQLVGEKDGFRILTNKEEVVQA